MYVVQIFSEQDKKRRNHNKMAALVSWRFKLVLKAKSSTLTPVHQLSQCRSRGHPLVFLASQQRGGLAGTSQRRRGFAPQLFTLQADGLGRH